MRVMLFPKNFKRSRSAALFVLLIGAAVLLGVGAIQDSRPAEQVKNEVIVMGMIHSGHRDSDIYGIDDIQRIVSLIEPDFILTEIPPDRWPKAIEEYQRTGKITEPRVRVFPEYVEAIIPMMKEAGFEIIPCAGWTREMADDRRAKLQEWAETRKAESAEVEAAQQWATDTIAAEGLEEYPLKIHTDRYDEIVRQGMEPYNRLFNDDLGLGGWDNINAAHMALIDKALDEHAGEGKRFLITFGAWHKYWFLDDLKMRDDIVLRELTEFVKRDTPSPSN